MGIDLKYHITSLIAIFLSLGIGILVGSALVPNTTLIERQNAIISRLEKDFAKIRQESRRVQKEVELSRRFEKESLSLLIADRLKGMRVAIIGTNEENSSFIQNDLTQVLEQAEVEISSVTIIKKRFGLQEEDKKLKIYAHLGVEEEDSRKVAPGVAGRLAKEIARGGDCPLLSYLQGMKVLYSKGDYNLPARVVILVGGSGEKKSLEAQFVDLPMVRTFKESGVRVIGVEKVKVKTSYVRYYQQEDLSTVDNTDTIAGQVALIYVLEGREGNFGVKEPASSLLPKWERGS